MTITITKLRLGAAMLALAMLVPATAWAGNVFVDVAHTAFYAEAAEWARTANITTGSPSRSNTFKPLDGVTRGESVTFLKRYHDNMVQPDLFANAVGVATNTASASANTAAIAAARTAPGSIIGSIRVMEDGSTISEWMADGSTPTVTRTAVGKYTVTWTGLSFNINQQGGFGNILSSVAAGSMSISSFGGDMLISTFDGAAAAKDQQFWAFLMAS